MAWPRAIMVSRRHTAAQPEVQMGQAICCAQVKRSCKREGVGGMEARAVQNTGAYSRCKNAHARVRAAWRPRPGNEKPLD
eukprot:scaffold32490_cov58-Phaeocystis_antarctica.AAC.2